MKITTYETGMAATAALALLVAPATSLTQPVPEPFDNAAAASPRLFFLAGPGNSGRFDRFILRDRNSATLLLGGASSQPTVVNVTGPGLLIRCGQVSSGGASIEYEFSALEPTMTVGPDPRTEAAVRRLSEEFARGEPNYELMTPCMAAAARAELDSLRRRFTSMGPIRKVTVNEDWSSPGIDAYDVEYDDGSLTWVIALTQDGKTKVWMFHDD